MKIIKPKHFKEIRGIRGGGYTTTVQDILPYLPNEDCFFDCRHFVYDSTSGVLPFSLTTRIAVNNQQYLKIMKPRVIKEQNSIAIPQATKQGYVEVTPGSVFDAAYPESTTRRGRVQEGGQVPPTLCTTAEVSLYEGVKDQEYRIRKLTPKECFRLMGVGDREIDILLNSGISNAQLYKMAGNSIVVDVLYHIFRKLFIEKENENLQQTLF